MAKSMSLAEKMDYAFDAFGSIGIGREATIGAFGSMMGESGRSLNTAAYNPNDPKGGSRGIAQHNGSRLTAMENFKSKWGDVKDFRHQVDFVVHELKTTEKKTADKLRAEGITRTKAADTWTKSFERPKDPDSKLAERRANAEHISKELSKAVANIATPEVGPTPQARPDPTSVAQTQATATTAPGFDVGRFGAPSQPVAQAASFDMSRFGPATAPSMSVATMDRAPSAMPTTPSTPTQTAQAAPGFDVGRFGDIGFKSQTVSPEAKSMLGYTPEKLADPVAAIAAAAPTQSLADLQSKTATQPTTASTPFSLSRPEVAFRDPMVNAQPAGKTTTSAASTQTKSTDIMGDLSAAIGGVASGVKGAASALGKGDIHGAFAAMPGSATPTPAQAAAQQAKANTEQAGAKSKGFLEQDTNITGAIGAIAGGIFGGAPGAIAGGLVGQGIGKALEGITNGITGKSADKAVQGVESGFSRAVESLFGDNVAADKAAGMPQGGWNQQSYPNAPAGGSRQSEDRSGWDDRGSQQTRDAIDSGSSGLW